MTVYGDGWGFNWGNPGLETIANITYINETDIALTINHKFGGSRFGTGFFGSSGNNQIQTIADVSYTAEI